MTVEPIVAGRRKRRPASQFARTSAERLANAAARSRGLENDLQQLRRENAGLHRRLRAAADRLRRFEGPEPGDEFCEAGL